MPSSAAQLDLFAWAASQPTNVIQARQRFEERTVALAIALARGGVPKLRGKVIPFIKRPSSSPPPATGSGIRSAQR